MHLCVIMPQKGVFMSEPTMESADQIKTFINAVRKKLDEDVFLRYENPYFDTHAIYDVMDKKRTPLIIRDFYRDHIFISETMCHEINKDIKYSVYIAEAYNNEFSGPWVDEENNIVRIYIPKDEMDTLSGAIHNVKLTRKARHKDVIALQRYFRNFIRTRFEQVL